MKMYFIHYNTSFLAMSQREHTLREYTRDVLRESEREQEREEHRDREREREEEAKMPT